MKMKRLVISLLYLVGFTGLSACGVKGPPLPPVADTPDASDRTAVSGSVTGFVPSPVPSPMPDPSPTSKKRRKSGQ